MKEYRFKVMQEGDSLHSFSDTEMIIRNANGECRIYKIYDFAEGAPLFSKEYETISICTEDNFNDKVIIIKKNNKYIVYRVDKYKQKAPVLCLTFVVIITNGIGKIEVFDPRSKVTIKLPTKES